MFRPEWRPQRAFDPLSPSVHEFLDLLNAYKQKVRAREEANKLTRLLLKEHTRHTKLTLTDGNTLEITLSGDDVHVVISQDQELPFHIISAAGWDSRTKELLEYEEFDTEGKRVGSVRKNMHPLVEDEPLYTATDNQGGIRIVDFDIGLQRRVYDRAATMFTLARATLALEKTTNRLLPHQG